jgi:hypothetical protein
MCSSLTWKLFLKDMKENYCETRRRLAGEVRGINVDSGGNKYN